MSMSKKSENSQKQRVQVFARCRPLNNFERKQCSPSIVEVIPEKKEIIVKDRNTSREFFFDKVFPPDTKQINVYKAVVGPLIREVLLGYNCTVFAYGQTGTGKTYTMEGERSNTACSWEDDPGAGIIPRSLHQLFEELNKEDNVEFSVHVSFLELYNEELFDLLSSAELSRLRLFEDSTRKGSVIIQGLEEIIVNSKDEVYAILERGTARRQTAATLLNATSSRSHTVFSVTVHLKENTVDGEELLKTGKLNLVDLAGSENVGRSGAVDKRAREAGNINQSLLTLGRVITALIEKQPHVPYRESKLTRLLQDSLGGHTKTSIIATISPALCNSDDTLSTLDYATKAKSITIKPEANQRMEKKALIKSYTDEIEKLRRDLIALRNQEGFYVDTENYMSLLNDISEKKDMIKYLQGKIEFLKEEKQKSDEKYEKTSDELNQTYKKYKEKEQELLSTANALNYTQKVLSETTLERDEKQYLINVLRKTEDKLLKQAQTLLHVADQSTYEVDKLHEKLERKQNVEKSNEEHCKDFRITYQKQFAKLDDMVTNAEEEQINNLDCIKANLGYFGQYCRNSQQQTVSCLNDIVNECKMRLTNISRLTTKTIEQNQWAESLLQDINFKEGMLSVEQRKFLSDTLPLLLNQINIMHTVMENWLIAACAAICEKTEHQKEILRKRAEEKSSLISTIQKSLLSFQRNHENILLKLRQQIHSNYMCLVAQEKSFNEKCQALEEFVDAFKKFGTEQKKIKEDTLQTKETAIEAESNLTCLRSIDESLIMLFKPEDNQADEAMLDATSSAIKITEYCDNKELLLQKQENLITAFKNFLDEREKNEKENFIKIKTEVQNNSSSVAENLLLIENIIKEMNSSVEENVQNAKASLEKDNIKIYDDFFETQNIVNAAKESFETNVKQVKEEILKRALEFEGFLSEDLIKDVPTGTTPQRTVYVYPKVLAASSPYDRILQRYRSKLALDTAIAVNLPLDSSFNEQDELKNSPPFLDGTSDVFDLSSADSEDSEANSCASSMSELSVQSNKNKENKKTSCLPKRVKTTKIFDKPALPANRKPLAATNCDLDN